MHHISYLQAATWFSLRYQRTVTIIYCHKSTKIITDLIYDSFHMVILLIRRIFDKLFIYLHCCTKSSCLVHIKGDEYLIPLFHLCGLFAEGKQQVFFQPPVQKCADSCRVFHRKHRQLSNRNLRHRRCRDQTVTGIFVKKYFYRIPQLDSRRNLFLRKEYPLFLCSQIHTEIHFFYNRKHPSFSQFIHQSHFHLSPVFSFTYSSQILRLRKDSLPHHTALRLSVHL